MRTPPLSRDQVRRVDQIAIERYGMSGLVLMENAGRGAAEVLHRVAPNGRVVILCGKGNNAGDGYVIARHLQLVGRDVQLVSLADLTDLTESTDLAGDAAANASIARAADIPITIFDGDRLPPGDVLVDCLLGTGAVGDPRGDFATAIDAANAATAIRVAIDIPSGLDCDTGQPSSPTFRADHTITFVATKIGFANESAKAYVGEVHEVGIGVPQKLLRELLREL
jgi:NAD(P)H-hydrate epimerase